MSSSDIGKIAEEKAVNFLKQKGYTILDRNFRTRYGEIDIIASKDKTLVFVEVRFRSGSFISPEESIDHRKVQRIIKTANAYLTKTTTSYENIRFDVIAIDKNQIRHIENAFDIM
ncbi:YraN family protein [Persephonella sp. KM09-Lau-8]|uniref:YraN family protein n=1 Tax=Persephonella sp. KM09-Lau-8 TaxID=1158345 RepID=UPI000495BF6B|nr:YraN family protein [Persephonella sp. KM09-Lau-8]